MTDRSVLFFYLFHIPLRSGWINAQPEDNFFCMARKADPEKKGNIIGAAILVFAQKGYAATRIIDVARAAGIGKGTVYEYFRSKEELFFSVFQQVMQDTEIQMAAAAESGSGGVAQRLKVLADALISAWLDKLDLYSLVMEFWSAATASASRERFKTTFQTGYQAFRQTIAALIQEGVSHGEFSRTCRPVQVASGLIGMWDALLLQAWVDSSFDALGASRVCLEVMLKGLGNLQDQESI
jgi:AcrR family transcriptional regulator